LSNTHHRNLKNRKSIVHPQILEVSNFFNIEEKREHFVVFLRIYPVEAYGVVIPNLRKNYSSFCLHGHEQQVSLVTFLCSKLVEDKLVEEEELTFEQVDSKEYQQDNHGRALNDQYSYQVLIRKSESHLQPHLIPL